MPIPMPIRNTHNPDELLSIVNRAFDLAESAARSAAECFAQSPQDAESEVRRCERELDTLDRELDQKLAKSLAGADEQRATELLTGFKLVIDLERIGDLLLSAITTGSAVRGKLEMGEVNEFTHLCSIVEQMISNVHRAYRERNIDDAMKIFPADAEIDRRRNLIVMRQINAETNAGSHAIHVVAIAQAIERAGDHVTNLAEEVAHLATGRSLRHSRRSSDKPDEVAYIERMRRHYKQK